MDTASFDIGVTLVGSEPGLNKDFADKIQRMGIELRNFQLNGRIDFAGIRELRNYIKKNNFDVVHCHDFKANFYGLMATLGTGVKRVTTVHGSTKDSFLLWLFLAFNEYILIRFFNKIIVVSEHLKKELKGKFLNSQKVVLIPNGLDLSFFKESNDGGIEEPDLVIPPGKTVLGTVGRLFPDKGHEDLFKALLMLKDEFPNLILLIVGDGPYAEYLKALRDAMGLQDRVIFAGVRHDMKRVYEALHIFVMPSIREGLPMALLEAMLAGVPVVATRVGGMPSVLEEGKRGRMVDPHDPKGLAREIETLLMNPEEARQMAIDASAFIRTEYSSAKMALQTEKVYREVL